MSITREEALEYHRRGRPGKISVTPTKPLATQRDLALAYTPGVAEPVLVIERDPAAAYEYTAKGNLVAVVSNGTAILGLGDRGPLASKPVMEGKAVLFKTFADVDVFDIEIDARTVDDIVRVVAALAPTFGGINLEDIKAPECFEVEERLKAMLDIPVFHDDQHGTAIISGAALLNGLELVDKDITAIRVVVSGAGAAAVSCSELAVRLGVRRENILLVDTRGVVHAGRQEGMNPYKARFAAKTDARSLSDAMRDADVFYGLSAANVLTPDMVRSMAQRPLIFAMANPEPEIRYELAKDARPDAIVATGRSDYPNQINNVLGFPFIFRGALDVRARAINEEMKIAAARALADLAKQDVPDSVLHAYDLESLKFGPEYIIPKPFDPRVLLWESPAVAQAAMESGAARLSIDLDDYRAELALRQGKGMRVRQFIMNRARQSPRRVVFGEGEETKIIRAAVRVLEEGVAIPILLGRPEVIAEKLKDLGLTADFRIVNPREFNRLEAYARAYYERRQRKGITFAQAVSLVQQRNVFGPMMVAMGEAEAFVSGLTYEYPEVIRPALQIFHTRAAAGRAAGAYLMIVDDHASHPARDRVYIFTDATVNIEPTAEDLAEIACLAADLAIQLELEPRVALLSFSNFGSTDHPLTAKVRRAVELIRARRPELIVDGEMQADTAVVPAIIDERYPFSRVRDANVLVFPSLEAANVAYKLLSRLGNAQAIGPILLGLGAPVHVLQIGDDVEDIVHIAAVAVLDAQARQK
jgi:malate dehydrogenase (oxaloacetate-decarboxylating)(NADP+)